MITEAMNDILAHIDSLNLGVAATAHQGTAANELNQGRPVIVLTPPRVTPLTKITGDFEWSVIVAAGPSNDPLKATEAMDPILLELMDDSVLTPTEAQPNVFQTIQNANYPCYVLTCATQHD